MKYIPFIENWGGGEQHLYLFPTNLFVNVEVSENGTFNADILISSSDGEVRTTYGFENLEFECRKLSSEEKLKLQSDLAERIIQDLAVFSAYGIAPYVEVNPIKSHVSKMFPVFDGMKASEKWELDFRALCYKFRKE